MDSKSTPMQEDYMLGHGFRESARLHLQHWMWLYRSGYLLHPSIPKRSQMRIIDIGTGNGCWLVELAHQSPPTWQLQGVDISRLQFPADEYLPKNVSLTTMDAFGDICDDYVEKFDVVHIRTFAVVITHSDPMALLKNLVRMLKPGGYLQWDEFDATTYSAHAPNENTEKKNCEELLRVFQLFTLKAGVDFTWIPELSSSFKSSNLELIHSSRLRPIDDLRKAFTDNCMMGMEEVGAIASAALEGSHVDFRELLKNALQETQQGVSLGMDMVVIVGRKPTGQLSCGPWTLVDKAFSAVVGRPLFKS